IYFHRNSVVGAGFDRLTLGALVRFSEEMGEKGPQASTVKIMKRGLSTAREAIPSLAEPPGDRRLPGMALPGTGRGEVPRESSPETPSPKVAMPPRVKAASPFRKILVPLDGSLTSEAILTYVQRYFPAAELILLRTPEGPSPGLSAVEAADEVQQYL